MTAKRIEKTYDRINAIQAEGTSEGVLGVMKSAAEDIGCDYFIVTGLPLPGRRLKPLIMAKHWPKGWLERYSNNQYEAVDPCAHLCFSSFNPFYWRDVPPRRGYEERSQLVMDEAGEYGMTQGVTVPIHTEDGFTAAVSFSGAKLDLPSDELDALASLAYIGHGHIRALNGDNFKRTRALTDREREILTWSALGKTNDDISTILNITRRTVEEHLKNSVSKLDSVNVKQAIANALFYGEISI